MFRKLLTLALGFVAVLVAWLTFAPGRTRRIESRDGIASLERMLAYVALPLARELEQKTVRPGGAADG